MFFLSRKDDHLELLSRLPSSSFPRFPGFAVYSVCSNPRSFPFLRFANCESADFVLMSQIGEPLLLPFDVVLLARVASSFSMFPFFFLTTFLIHLPPPTPPSQNPTCRE